MTRSNVETGFLVQHWGNRRADREALTMSLKNISMVGLRRLVLCAVVVAGGITPLPGEEAPRAADTETLQLLLKRIDQLESRVKQLEFERTSAPADSVASRTAGMAPAPLAGMDGPPAAICGAPGSGNSQVASTSDPAGRAAALQNAVGQSSHSGSSDSEAAQPDAMMERMDVSRTLLRMRGFGDISFHGNTQKGETTSFSLGQLDLFVTSDVSDKFKFLSEIVFEGGPSNIYGNTTGEANSFSVDVERYLLQYSHNDYLNISAGRVHTSIGYYNTTYHHSSWLQTTTGRPFLFDFEDHGGILPIHMVGVSATGQIPSGSLGLHYVAEVGNGRASRQPLDQEPVQNVVDDQNHKAYNIALFARPDSIHGLQAGVSFYRDLLAPENQPKVHESILAAHAVLVRSRYEWLNEALLDRHVLQNSSVSFNTPGFYSQVSKQFGSYRPYFRYQYVNAPDYEPIYPGREIAPWAVGGGAFRRQRIGRVEIPV